MSHSGRPFFGRLGFRTFLSSYASLILILLLFMTPALILFLGPQTLMNSSKDILGKVIYRFHKPLTQSDLNTMIKVLEASAPPFKDLNFIITQSMNLGFTYLLYDFLFQFVLAGMIAGNYLAKPLEDKYFFLEVIERGGRLQAFRERLTIALIGLLVPLSLSSPVLAKVLYVDMLVKTEFQAYAYALSYMLMLTLSSISIASALAVYSKKVSDTLLGIFGFAMLVLILQSRLPYLAVLVFPYITYQKPSYGISFFLSIAFLLGLSLVRVRRIEY